MAFYSARRNGHSRQRATTKSVFSCVLAIALAHTSAHAESLKWVQKPELTFDRQTQQWLVTFELESLTDVEVAIVESDKSTVVRHLAAGVPGPKVPPPLVVNSRSQKIEWDGKDDYGQPVSDVSKLVVRVREG